MSSQLAWPEPVARDERAFTPRERGHPIAIPPSQPELPVASQQPAAIASSEPLPAEVLGLHNDSGGLLPMQHPAWVISCATTFVSPTRLELIAAPIDGTHRALAPLWRAEGLVPRLHLLGHAETGEPSDLLWADESALQSLAERLAHQPLGLLLQRVPADSPSIAALRRAWRGRGLLWVREAVGTPTLALDPSWVLPQDKFNARRRSDFRRAERHADKLGGLSFEIHERVSEQQLDRLLDEAYAVEARSWKGDSGHTLMHDPVRGAFFRRYAHTAMRSGLLRLALMRVGGVAVAMQIAAVWQERFWLLKIGYDPAYAKCSPGQLLMLHTVQHAAQQGLKSYEFLGNPAPWTAAWTGTLRPCVRVMAYPFSLPGMLGLAADALRAVRQRLQRRRLA